MKQFYTRAVLPGMLLLFSFSTIAQSIKVSPAQWNKAKTLTITISGSNTNFMTGKASILIRFTKGSYTLIPDSFTVNSDTNITATVFVPNTVPTGFYDAYVYNAIDGGITQSVAIAVMKRLPPYIVQVYPDTIRRRQELPVGIVALNTNFDRDSSVIWLQYGSTIIYSKREYVYSSGVIIAYISVPAAASTGWYNVFAKNSIDSTLAFPSAVYISSAALPEITGFIPDSARRGQTVNIAISGKNTHMGVGLIDTYAALVYGSDKDSITGSIYKLNSATSAEMTFSIPLNADTGSYELKVYSPYDGIVTAKKKMHIRQSLVTKLTGVSPSDIGAGQKRTITISANKTSFKSVTTRVWINQGSVNIYPSSYSILASDAVKATFTIPANTSLGYYNVNVYDTTDATLTLENGIRITRPRIKSISPAKASAGKSLTATVSAFGMHYLKDSISDVWLVNGSDKIPGYNFSISNDSTFNAKFSIPGTSSGYYKLFVVGGKGDTLQLDSAMKIDMVSEIKLISPDSSLVNNNLTVSINGKNLKLKTGTISVWLSKDSSIINGTNIAIGTDDSLSFKVTIPSNAASGYYDVNISNSISGNVAKPHAFYITSSFAAARIVTVKPDSARRTKTLSLVIIGQNSNFTATPELWFTQGSVTLYPDKLTANSNTSLSADITIPLNASLGWYNANVSDYKDGNLDYSNALYVEDKPAGALTTAFPDSVYQGDSVTVDIYGSNTILDHTKSYDILLKQGSITSIVAYHISIISSEHIRASFYAGYTDAIGWYELSISNSYDQLSLANALRVVKTLHPPVIVSFSPHKAVQGDTVVMDIRGDRTNFSQYATVYLLSGDSIMLTGTVKAAASATDMQVQFAIPRSATAGSWHLFVDDRSSGLLEADSVFTLLPETGITENLQNGLLLKAYPDPFEQDIQLEYHLAAATGVQLQLTDISGRVLYSRLMGEQEAGNFHFILPAADLKLRPGVYFIRLDAGDSLAVVKVFRVE